MTETVPPTEENLRRAADLLRAGQLVAFPTETVYGLGGDAGSDAAVAAIFAAKGRPRFNPLIVHVADMAAAESLAVFDEPARLVARAFWPGPLTLVLPRRPEARLSLLASAGLDTVAIRMPAHPVARKLLALCGVPVAAPSANRSGRLSPTVAAHVAEELGDRVAMILDGGATQIGLESTVLALTGGTALLLRPGSIGAEALSACLGVAVETVAQPDDALKPSSPGQLASHYAPRLPVRLMAREARAGEVLLGFGPVGAGMVALNLSPAGDLQEAAANLFAMLRALDLPDFTGIAVMPIPETGLGIAINDRLRRAAAPRQ